MSGKLVLVTGISGFLAGHVVEQLLAAGYRVRGTARSPKIASIQALKIANLEVVAADDISTADLTEALKGVDAVVHVAAPLPGKSEYKAIIDTVIEGTLNVVRQAEKAGIKKIVVTSSFGTAIDPSLAPAFGGLTFNDESWGKTSQEEIAAQPGNGFYAYFAVKILAEHALWDFAKSHNLDVATILPGFIFGPWTKLLPRPTKGSPLGTNSFPWLILNGQNPPTAPPFVVDVRDTAKAHVLALELPPAAPGTKRFLVNGGNYTWKEAAENLKKVRPELTTVADPASFSPLPGPASTLDTTRSKTVLGLKETIPPSQTILDTIDALLDLQKEWAAAESA